MRFIVTNEDLLFIPVKKPIKSGKHNRKAKKISKARERKNRRINALTAERKASTPSKNEQRIINFLMQNHANFYREYYFNNCKSDNGYLLYWDFYLPDYKLLIEFDGIHHFEPVYGEIKFEQQKYRDRTKTKWANKNRYHLLRIPYFKANDIEHLICKKLDYIKPTAI